MSEFIHCSPRDTYRNGGEYYHRFDYIIDGQKIGMAGLMYKNSPFPFYHVVVLDIDKQRRGCGYGRDLLMGVNNFLDRKKKCGILVNSITVGSPARGMYQQHGWKEIHGFPFWYIYNPPQGLPLGRIEKAIFEIGKMLSPTKAIANLGGLQQG